MEQSRRSLKIVLDPGHGGKDPGAMFRALREADIVLDMALACLSRLQLWHCVALTRTSDVYVPLADRVQIANWWGADLFVSIHTNADPDPDESEMPEGKGEEIWIRPKDSKSLEIANHIKGHVDSFFPEHHFRGVKETKNLYVLKETKMPALLIETGFIDNINEHTAFANLLFRRRIGMQLAEGILEYNKGKQGAV